MSHRRAIGPSDDGECEPSEVASHGCQPRPQKGGKGRLVGRSKGGLTSKIHAVTDAVGRPIRLFLSAGQTSAYIGARALLSSLPAATHLLTDRG